VVDAVGIFALNLDWDIAIRGILVFFAAMVILPGSVYLLLATNLGNRLGFLIALAGFFGWMTIMSLIWWVYGIGKKGEDPSWKVREIVVSEQADDLSSAGIQEARDLSRWNEIPEGEPSRGEAQASAEAALTGDSGLFEETEEFEIIDVFERGGKGDSFVDGWLPLPHPTHYAIVQAQAVIPVVQLNEGDECPEDANCIPFGETPPEPELDVSEPVVSAVMARDLGSRRLPPAIITIACAAILGVVANQLHRRDKLATALRAQSTDLEKVGPSG